MKTIEYLDSIIREVMKLGSPPMPVIYLVLPPDDLRKFEDGLKELGSFGLMKTDDADRLEYNGFTFFVSSHQMP